MEALLADLILDVSDLPRSLAFYEGVLGLAVLRRESLEGNAIAYLEAGGTRLLLLQQPIDDQPPWLDRRGGMVLKFYTDNLLGLLKTAQARATTVLRPLEVHGGGESSVLLADPDGYVVMVATLHAAAWN